MLKNNIKELTGMTEEEFLEQARKRFQAAKEAVQQEREEALEDWKFRSGKQWHEQVEAQRIIDNRPVLVINKIPQFVKQVTNDQKQNRPAIKIKPVDDVADPETAEIYQGIIRNIETQSDAETAYDNAMEGAVNGGFGFYRLTTDYVDERSFEQRLVIEALPNPFNVLLDPYHMRVDGGDARYGFIQDNMDKEEFLSNYSDSELSNHANWEDFKHTYGDWINGETLRVCEYYTKIETPEKLFQLSDNKGYFKDELPEQNEDGSYSFEKVMTDPMTGEEVVVIEDHTVVNERMSKRCKVVWATINAVEVLEITKWVDDYEIPIISVYGDTYNVDGKVIHESIIRHAKDPQRVLNYWASTEAEVITLAPKAPFIGAEGQFEDHEHEWKYANVKNFPYLEYKPVTLDDGTLIGPPQRNNFEPPVMAVTNARMQANQDMKETTGIYDASLGNRSNETSGIAIRSRVTQALTSNFHFVDNLNKSIQRLGKILVRCIPRVYDTERAERIMGEAGEERLIKLNQMFQDGEKEKYIDLSVGKYDAVVSTGPNYETKRQEARDWMIEMSRVSPKFAELAADLMVKNMDLPYADEISERIKKTMPPDIISSKEDKVPPVVAAQMAQMNQLIERLTNELKAATETIENEKLQLESKERIEAMKISADLRKELLKIQGKNSSIILEQELERINERLQQLGIDEPIDIDVGMAFGEE